MRLLRWVRANPILWCGKMVGLISLAVFRLGTLSRLVEIAVSPSGFVTALAAVLTCVGVGWGLARRKNSEKLVVQEKVSLVYA